MTTLPPPELLAYLDEEGRLQQMPGKRHQHLMPLVYAYLATKFEVGRVYSEREVNELLRQWHTFEDWALLRRELYERGHLNRAPDGSSYWRTPNVKLY